MLKYKLFGFLSMIVFFLPKFLPSKLPIESSVSEITKEFIDLPAKEIKILTPSTSSNRPIKVSASVYFPVESQTDSTPFITADGSKIINKKKPHKHRWIAVSRNLLQRWGGPINYGDTLHIKGISKKMDGHYIVRDTMTKRIKNRIDFLVGPDDNIMGFWKDVKIYAVN